MVYMRMTASVIYCIFTHSLYIHPLTVYSPTHSIVTHPLYIHPPTLYSHIHSIVTHPLYSHTSTQYSPNRCVFTQSLYTHLLSLFSPTHSIFGLPNALSEWRPKLTRNLNSQSINTIYNVLEIQLICVPCIWIAHVEKCVKSDLTEIWSILVSFCYMKLI